LPGFISTLWTIGADRDAASGIALPGFTSTRVGDHRIADLQALRRQDVGLLAVLVADQRDERRPVRVVLEPLDRRRHVELGPLEVDHPVGALVPAATMPRGDPAVLLRPPFLVRPSVSFLTGLPFQRPERSTSHQLPRWTGVVGLYCLSAIVLDPRRHVDRLALGERHDRLLDVVALAGRPRNRLVLPFCTSVLTAFTLTLNSCSTPSLISGLVASSGTSKTTWLCSETRVDFSVITGPTDDVVVRCDTFTGAPAPWSFQSLLQQLRRILGQHQRVAAQDVVDVGALLRQHVDPAAGCAPASAKFARRPRRRR
jgi:hypothetical protein